MNFKTLIKKPYKNLDNRILSILGDRGFAYPRLDIFDKIDTEDIVRFCFNKYREHAYYKPNLALRMYKKTKQLVFRLVEKIV